MPFAYVTLIGNLVHDPEITYRHHGIAMTQFPLAVTQNRGEKEETIWFNCTAWRGSAETLCASLRKGQSVFVQGKLSMRSYTTGDGIESFSLEVDVDHFRLLGGKPPQPAEATVGEATGASAAEDDWENHPF